jgi:hypothetical protein
LREIEREKGKERKKMKGGERERERKEDGREGKREIQFEKYFIPLYSIEEKGDGEKMRGGGVL